MIIQLYITPHEGVIIPTHFHYKGCDIKVLNHLDGRLSIELHEDLTIKDHMIAIRDSLGVEISKEKPAPVLPRVDFNIGAHDVDRMRPLGKHVWANIFLKPPAVLDKVGWCQSAESDKYVYMPNVAHGDREDEDVMHNGYVTEILVNAYKRMCESLLINPIVVLSNGLTISMSNLKVSHGLQNIPGNKAGRLANSTLLDFDDSDLGKEFIRSLVDLPAYMYESKATHRKVLAKVENILLGKSSHIHNQRFIQRFFERADMTNAEQADKILSVLKAMVMEGLALEDSEVQFMVKLRDCGMLAESIRFLQIYKSCLSNA